MKKIIYNGYELWADTENYGIIAVRPIGVKSPNLTLHFVSEQEAKDWVDNKNVENSKTNDEKK